MHNDWNKSSFFPEKNVVNLISEYIIKVSTINWDFRKKNAFTPLVFYTGLLIFNLGHISWETPAPK